MADLLVSIEDLKVFLGEGFPLENQDGVLEIILKGVLALWDKLTGRTWSYGTFTEYYNIEVGSTKVVLLNKPVASITSIHNDPDWDYGTDDLIDSGDYVFNGNSGIVYFNSELEEGDRALKVIYLGGYTEATLPNDIRLGILKQSSYSFKSSKDHDKYNKEDLMLKSFKDLAFYYRSLYD